MSADRRADGTLRIVLLVLAILLLSPLLLMGFMVPMMGMWGGFGGPGVTPLWGLLAMLVPLVVLLGAGYLAYRWLAGEGGVKSDPALEELRMAYARGELSEEEFEKRRATLERE